MRKIKFRGKRINNGEWVYGYLIGKDVIVGEIVEFCDEYFNTEFWWKVVAKTVGQYTGLRDKNGKEIYEGDILDVDGTPWLIKPIGTEERIYEGDILDVDGTPWPVEPIGTEIRDGGKFGLCASPYGSGEAYLIDKSILDGKIIGNIYENPELLKGGKTA